MTELRILRPLLPVIFVLDTSGSMEGNRIRALNIAMCELRQQLEQLADSEGLKVRIGALQFSSGCRWVTGEELVPMDELVWDGLKAGGMTNMGAALQELDAMLFHQVRGLFYDCYPICRPVIIFVTDGMPTDEWQHPLEIILQNELYMCAVKCAIALGDDVDVDILAQIVQGEENVLVADDGEQFGQLLVRQTMECCANCI